MRTQREGGWRTHRLLALTSYASAKFRQNSGIAMAVKWKHEGLQKARIKDP